MQLAIDGQPEPELASASSTPPSSSPLPIPSSMSYAPSLVLSATDVDSELMFAPPASLISSIELECPPSPIRLATEDQLVPEPLLCTPSITLISPSLPSIPSLVSPSANDVKIASMPSSVSLTDFGCLPQHEHDLKSVFLPSPSAIEISLLSVLSTPAPLLPSSRSYEFESAHASTVDVIVAEFPGVVPVALLLHSRRWTTRLQPSANSTRSDATARTVIVILSKLVLLLFYKLACTVHVHKTQPVLLPHEAPLPPKNCPNTIRTVTVVARFAALGGLRATSLPPPQQEG
ncbi:hypothetical protein EDB85DRAFT_2151992 [Lactarius pseudohatsudake]|nr:hypothetical protein EDB85DRAFT_2151992 [Lactarius pseudohatsudake]